VRFLQYYFLKTFNKMKIGTCFWLLILTITVLVCGSCEPLFKPVLPPGLSIYKTNGDYFELADIGMKGDKIFRTSIYSGDMYKFITTNGDTIYKYRIKLRNGYVLDFAADSRYDVFLDLTFKQHMSLEKIYPGGVSHGILLDHIIDKNPYSVYYRDTSEPRLFGQTIETVDTIEINQIIKEGNLDKYFEKLK
jgi:hypothetical protein